MTTDQQIINRVTKSTLTTLDLEQYHISGERVLIDMRDMLYQGLLLREKDFRQYIITHNWNQYQEKFIAITCSTNAIIPTWAYMLITTAVSPFAKKVIFGTLQQLEERLLLDELSKIDWTVYLNAKVVIKGCNKKHIPESAYVEVVNKLLPIASSIMFGEPCSTVPLFKRPKAGS